MGKTDAGGWEGGCFSLAPNSNPPTFSKPPPHSKGMGVFVGVEVDEG